MTLYNMTLSPGIYYSEKSGYKLTGDIGKATYKTKALAAAACKKSAVCTGMTY